MSFTPAHEPGRDLSPLFESASIAAMRVDLGLLTPVAREEARRVLRASGQQFDGQALVATCLAGRAGDGEDAVRRALLALRSRLIGVETVQPRRRASWFVRWSARLIARFIFFALYTVVIVALLFLLKRRWPAVDLYEFGDRLLALFK
jgi:hypothetical protein